MKNLRPNIDLYQLVEQWLEDVAFVIELTVTIYNKNLIVIIF